MIKNIPLSPKNKRNTPEKKVHEVKLVRKNEIEEKKNKPVAQKNNYVEAHQSEIEQEYYQKAAPNIWRVK